MESAELASAHGKSGRKGRHGDNMDESNADLDSVGEPAIGDGRGDENRILLYK